MDPAGANHHQLGDIDSILGIVLVTLLGCLLSGAREVDFPLPKGTSPWWVQMPEGAGKVGTT